MMDCVAGRWPGCAIFLPQGPLAQLGERRVRNAEVVGSSPMRSTNTYAIRTDYPLKPIAHS